MKNEFGPNQGAVDELLERLETVNQSDAMFLGSFSDDPERQRARRRVRDAARLSHRERELEAAHAEVRQWVNMWFTGGFQISGYGRDVSPGEAAVSAAPVVLDAVGALVVKDQLAPEDVEMLTGPWRELVDAPAER